MASLSLYRVNTTKGITCILIATDGLLDVTYRTVLGEDVTSSTFLPDDVELSGDCSEEDVETLYMKFKGFTLYMLFKKTPGGERWYVSIIELSYSTSNPLLKQIDRPNLQVSEQCPLTTKLFRRVLFNDLTRIYHQFLGETLIGSQHLVVPNASWQILYVQ